MRKIIFALSCFASISGFCQKNEILGQVVATCNAEEQRMIQDKIQLFIDDLSKKRPASDLRFLQKVFYKTHQQFLKEYKAYSSMAQLIKTGTYDCLTATSLYSSILERLGFEFRIIETNYHIFILAKVNGKEFLLETTDGYKGFISDQNEIQMRIVKYQNEKPIETSTSSKVFEYDFNLFREVKGYQLPGLIYFNQAVMEFNHHHWTICRELLTKSSSVYNSPRVSEIMNIVVQKTEQIEAENFIPKVIGSEKEISNEY